MKKAYFTSFVTILLLTFISVAYAAFSSDLKITGEASVLKDTVPPTCGSWYLRDSSLTTQEAFNQNKFINAGTNTTWTNTNKTLFIECSDNLDGDYGCINVDTVTTSAGGKRYFKDVKNYTTSIKTDGNAVTVTLKDAYQNERTCTLPVGGSNPYVDKQGPSITISRTAANKFTYSATDDMSSVVTTQYMVTTSSTQPSINDSGWSSNASEVTIDQTAAKTYYVWAKDGVNITHQTISTYKLTKTQGTGTTLTLKYNNNSGAELNTSYVLEGTPVYVTASANNGYGSLVLKKDSTSISSGSTQTISGATTISSSATPNVYSITLNNQSATSGGTAKVWYKYNTVTDGCYYYTDSTLSTCLTNYTITKPIKTGYTYGGYYTSTNGGGTNYINTDGAFINNIYQKTPNQINSSYTTNIDLYAKWTAKTYTLTLNSNDATSAGTTSLTATYNSSAISQSSMTLASKSFTISGFGTAAARKSDGATVSSTSTLTSTATLSGYYTASTGGSLILAANSTPTFNTGSVSGYLSSGTWVRDANTTLYAQFRAMPSKTLPTITKTGYTCGWTTSSTGTTIQYQSGGNLIPTGNTTLYGVCTADTYTITYELNGGSQSNPKTTYNVETDTFTLVNPTKTGFTFEGWTGSNGSTLQKTVTITKGTTGNKTYTAHWGYYVEIYGSGYNQPSTKVHKVMIAGTQANTTSGRGLTVVKFNKLTGAVIHTASYDTYADDSARTDVASIINNSTNSELIAIFSQDATSFNTNLKTALTSAGIPSDRIYYANSSGRYPTAIFVGKGLTSSQAGMVEAFTEEFAPVSYLRIYVKDGVPQRETYSITYTLNGGAFGAAYPTYFDVSTTTFNLVNPTRTGYTFAGWTGSNGTTAQTTVSIAKGSSGDRVYTANWTPKIYTITLDRQSGSGGSDYVYEKYNTGYYTNSTATTQMTTSANPITAPTRTGYTFGGYYTSTGGAGTQYIDANGKLTSSASTTQFSANGSLYAKWTANKYYVYYNQGLATGGWSTSTYATQERTYPGSTTLRTNSMTKSNTTANSYTVTYNQGTATGGWNATTYGTQTSINTTTYTANGWTTGSTNTNDRDYENGATYGANSATNLTLYPNFTTSTTNGGVTTRTNSMTKSNSAASNSYTLTFKKGTASSAAPSAITNTKYTSYTANGWTTTSGSTTKTHNNNTATGALTGNITLYPCFSETVNQNAITLPAAATKDNTNLGTVTFNYNGSGASNTSSTAYNTYAFKGWYTAESGGTKLGDAGASYTPNASIDVYPQFTSTAHSATFPSNPTRTGYTFAGWWTAASGGTQVTSYTGTSAVTYYAHWTPITYTIAYTMNNGNNPNPKPTSGTYNSDVTIGTTSAPTKSVTITGNANSTGATVGSATINTQVFAGWSSSSGAGLGSGAKTGTSASPSTSWNGSATTNKYYKNLRDTSGTITLTANWGGSSTLPTVTKTGYTCSWYDTNGTSGGNYIGASGGSYTVPSGSSTAITVYARCTPNVYNITLNKQGGTGGTGTIYEKYSDGYYLTNTSGTVSNKMSTSANGVTVPTRSGYTFGGYYTSTNGGGTQYIDANGKLTSSASSTQFSSAGNLYAKWTLNTPATPTISGGATKVYGSSSTTLTCSNSTTYPSGITKKYQFGYASSDGGSPGNWTTESDSNTLAIAANAYVGQRWYSCRVRVYDGSAYSGYATSSTSADTEMTINNATLTFDANYGDGGGTVYTKTGQNVVYNGIRSTSTTSIPTASRIGYTFLGWYDAPSGGNKVLNADGSFTGTAVSGYTSTNTWVATANKTLYAYWNGITYTITFHYGDTQKNDIPYFTTTYQPFTIPVTGKYRLEAWGAQGGDSVNDGGSSHSTGAKGAYTSGVAPFNADDTLYVYVGQHPGYVSSGKANNPGGWNGGGTGSRDYGDNDSAGGGGGATDFRFFDDDVTVNSTILTWNNAIGLRYRIMVAAGGGGNAWTSSPGHGGALSSSPHGVNLKYATQTSGYAFGVGGSGTVYTKETKVGNAGGGGGYWGGYAGEARNTTSSGLSSGGSSYISGHTGAVAVINNAANTPRYASDGTTLCANGTTDNTCSIHFTNKVFEDTVMISGDSAPSSVVGTDEELDYMMREPDGSEVYGHAGNGYARVSLDSTTKQVVSGEPIGEAPLPYGNTYWAKYDDEGADDEGNPTHTYYNVLYDINWAYKGEVETEDDEGNQYYTETDVPIDLNETYDPFYGTDFYAYGTPHEYTITYENADDAFWWYGYGPGRLYIDHPESYNSLEEVSIPNPVSGMHSGTYYKFLGWTGTGLSTSTKDLTIEKGDIGDKVYTANWETKSTFSVTYNANGGTTTCANETGSYNETWYLCTTAPTYGDVQFLGWYTKPVGGTLIGTGEHPFSFQHGKGDYEGDWILYAHWDIDAIEYDYNISQSFAASRMMDTYYAPDWTKTFEVEIKFSVSTASKRYFLFGNYDNSASNALNIEVAQNNTIRVYVGKGSTNTTFGSVSTNQEITVKALWNGTTKKLTVDVTGGGTGHYEGTLTALTNISGKTNRNFRFGASDYRASSTPFNAINVKDFIIREFYGPPLQDTITVPDPAGHYLLFDGWTGTNGDTPQYGLTVPTNSEGLISYKANWSTGVSFKGYSKTFSTSNQYIKFKNEVTVVYIDQARRRAYTRERVYFYRTNTGYNTYGQGSMKVKYNWSASSQTWTVDLAGKKINENGINLWSENWNAYSISYRSIPYTDAGTRSVTLGVTSFTHAIFSVSTPKNASFTLPAIKPLN